MASNFGFWTSNWATILAKPIIIPEINPRKRIQLFFYLFLMFWFHFEIIFIIRIHYIELIACSTSQCHKDQIVLISLDLFILMSWYSFILKRTSLNKLFKEHHKFEDFFSNDDLKTLRRIVNGTIFGYLFFGVALMTVMLIYFTTDDDMVRKWYKSFNIFEAHFQVQRTILFVYIISSRVFLKLLPGVLILFYFSLFSSLILGLCRCEKEMARFRRYTSVLRFIDMYSVVNKLAESAESALSLTTFFFTCYYITSVYIMFSHIYHRTPAYDVILETEKLLTDVVQPLLIEITFLVTTEVHNRDVELRKKLKGKIYKMSLSASSSKSCDSLSRFMDSTPVMTFTAFKMFSLSRTLILTSMGCFLTYSLLILQLKPAGESLALRNDSLRQL